MHARAARDAGWLVVLGVALSLGCSPTTDLPTASATSGQNVAKGSDTVVVPADFPKMLGCAEDELANPSDPTVRAQLARICDVAQVGLYALSQDATLTDDQKRVQALMMMGAVLQKMTEVLGPTAVVSPDGGTVP
jgi:hypothetical protein